MELLFTLRPEGPYGDLSDESYGNVSTDQPGPLHLSAPLVDTHLEDPLSISHIIVRGLAYILDRDENSIHYRAPVLSYHVKQAADTYASVASWPMGNPATRVSFNLPTRPGGGDWTLADVLNLTVGAGVTYDGELFFSGEFIVTELSVDVWGVPSGGPEEKRFESGLYELVLDGNKHIARLTPREMYSIHHAASLAATSLTLTALALDSGAVHSDSVVTPNTTADAMLAAITNRGSALPEEL